MKFKWVSQLAAMGTEKGYPLTAKGSPEGYPLADWGIPEILKGIRIHLGVTLRYCLYLLEDPKGYPLPTKVSLDLGVSLRIVRVSAYTLG